MDRGTIARLEQELGAEVSAVQSLGGQHGVGHFRLQIGAGRFVFVKASRDAWLDGPGPGSGRPGDSGQAAAGPGFAAEASGLRWLAAAGATAVPCVLAVASDFLALDWIEMGAPEARATSRFGRELAVLHAAGAQGYGAPWSGVIAGLPLPNEPAPAGCGWAEWYAEARVLPYVRLAREAGALTADEAGLIEAAAGHAPQVAGPAEPPARIHGDCWSGNVLWSGGRGWLIDPAAHGGHRETDLAMLALFGAPYLDQILGGYQEVSPLADGWRARVPLHQLHPLLVHCCLFGRSYTGQALAAARAVLAL